MFGIGRPLCASSTVTTTSPNPWRSRSRAAARLGRSPIGFVPAYAVPVALRISSANAGVRGSPKRARAWPWRDAIDPEVIGVALEVPLNPAV